MNIASWGGSRKGGGRKENQDAWGTDPGRGLFVVCDGMGGHANGGEAARLAVETALAGEDPEATRAASDWLDLSRRAQNAHQAVKKTAASRGLGNNMGATLAMLWLREDKYLLATVGDSRAYLWRAGRLSQLSEDHTVVQGYVRQGLISPAEAEKHPERHMLRQALGVGVVEPDIFEGSLAPGDSFLLASDGLYEVVDAGELAQMLDRAKSLARAGADLLDLVEQREGDDDATVLLVGVGEE